MVDYVYSVSVTLAHCRQMGDDKGRTYELEQCAVKCMRGILFCYMRQAERVGVAFLPSPRSLSPLYFMNNS